MVHLEINLTHTQPHINAKLLSICHNNQQRKHTAKLLELHLTGEFVKCEDCAFNIGKGFQKNYDKRSDLKITGMVGENIFLDIALVQEQQKSGTYIYTKTKLANHGG
jgi:hypothetical protein